MQRISQHTGVQEVIITDKVCPLTTHAHSCSATTFFVVSWFLHQPYPLLPPLSAFSQEAKLIYHDTKTGMSAQDAQKYASNLSQLTTQARSVVRDLDPQNDLSFLRIRSKKHEIMVAPDKDFLLMVVQNPGATSK
jgi:hypothetical protein